MKLEMLLKRIDVRECHANQNIDIKDVHYNSATVQPGGLFVALKGVNTDGHRFIQQALDRGAVAVLCQTPPQEAGPWIVVEDSRLGLAVVSANFFGQPAEALTCLAVTGTNGKTTTTYLLKAILEGAVKAKVGLIGTNQNIIGDREVPTERTTPESYELQKLLRTMVDEGCTHVVMEASSIALDQRRTAGIRFTAGIFSNLTRDHLDYHGTMDSYRQAKGLLFDQCDKAILNLDDEAGVYFQEHVACPVYTYSERKDEADLVAKNTRLFPGHITFEAVTMEGIARIYLPIPGGFSIYNALGVIACGLCLGIPLADIADALRTAKGVRGRIEVVPVPADYTVIIDYAHTPDALENILTTVRDLTDKRLICLFGCGGNRDASKRPMMGTIAAALSDLCIVTSDNPRGEEPQAIIDDILVGMGEKNHLVEVDRRKAIRLALSQARAGDVIVLAGKGHETYQEVGDQKFHMDEREEVDTFFAQMVESV